MYKIVIIDEAVNSKRTSGGQNYDYRRGCVLKSSFWGIKIVIIDEAVRSKRVLGVKIVIIDEAVYSNIAPGCQNHDYR